MKNNHKLINGFTLIELLVVFGIIGIITGFSFTNVLTSKNATSFETSVTTFISDLKEQQNKAMIGDTDGTFTKPQAYGIRFGTSDYSLFQGQYYYLGGITNFKVNLGDQIQFSNIALPTQFPSNEKVIVFATSSGEIVNFVNGQNSFKIKNINTGEQKTITINKYGTIISVN